jgi:hypothetical protein
MRKTTAALLLAAGIGLSIWGVVAYGLMVDRVYSDLADADGFSLIAVDFSPDAPQRDLYLSLVLALGLLALQSRRWAGRSLVLASIAYFGLEALFWFGVGRVTFDSVSTASHVAAGIGLALGITVYRRRWSPSRIASIAPAIAGFEYAIWAVDTVALRRACEVAVLQPPTILNNMLYGAQWHHAMTCLLALAALAVLLVGTQRCASPEARSN